MSFHFLHKSLELGRVGIIILILNLRKQVPTWQAAWLRDSFDLGKRASTSVALLILGYFTCIDWNFRDGEQNVIKRTALLAQSELNISRLAPLGFSHLTMISNWHAFAYQNTFFLNVMPYFTFSEMNSSHLNSVSSKKSVHDGTASNAYNWVITHLELMSHTVTYLFEGIFMIIFYK